MAGKPEMKPYIIAEFGSSPAPEWDFATWCRVAELCGADAVKVQLFKAEHFPLWEQEEKRKLEFPRARFHEFVSIAHVYELKAGASVFDDEAVRMVAEQGDFIKIAAREQHNYWLCRKVTDTGKAFYQSFNTLIGKYSLEDYGAVPLYTVSEYPTPIVHALIWLYRVAGYTKGAKWGWSSHTRYALDSCVAARIGASVIEKHLALGSRDIEARHSLLPRDFAKMVKLCKTNHG